MARHGTPNLHRVEQAAHDLLAGRTTMTASELLDAIHAINPTGRSLAAADERRRYELKARLQSLLIRRWIDDLEVTLDPGVHNSGGPGGPGIVALRHRYLGSDACHARLDELEDDARAQVQWRLDVGQPEAAPAAATEAPATVTEAAPAGELEAGRAALAEFDYDAARACFERAALHAGAEPAAAGELLALLVDHLALYDEARALERQLPARAIKDAEVRALLAIAAARAGDAADATRLLAEQHGPRAADAWCALAQGAADRRCPDEVEQYVSHLVKCDPAHPEIVRLRGEASRLHAEARRPAEQELLQLAARGDDAATEARARELLARWPGTPVAGRLLAQLQERRRAEDAARHLEHAREALRDGKLERASELCVQARTLGADVTGLAEELRVAGEAQRLAREQAEVTSVCAQLAEPEPRAGLASYLRLDPALRRRVRDRAASRMLGWLEQAAPRGKEHRHGASIDGVLALGAAEAAVARGDDEDALALLDRHAELLAAVAEAHALRAGAVARIAARRRDAASAALERAQGALAAGELALAERTCAEVDPRALDTGGRAALDEVRRTLRARRDRAQRREQIDQLAATGDLVAARRALESLVGAEDGDAERAQLDELRAAVRRSWRIRHHETDDGPPLDARRALGELYSLLPYHENAAPWLCADGRELLAARSYGDQLFVVRVSIDDARVRARHALTPPAPLGDLIELAVDGETLWLVGSTGRVLQLAWRTCEPVRWAELAPLLAPGERLERAFVVPPAAHLWFEAAVPAGGDQTQRVLEIDSWRVRRELPVARSLHPVLAGARSGVLGMGWGAGTVRYSERGTLQDELTACAHLSPTDAVIDPEGDLIVLGSRPRAEEEDDATLEIRCIEHGRTTQRLALPGSSYELAHRAASVRDPSGLFVHYRVDRHVARLAALRRTRAALAPIFDVPAPAELVLAQDPEATRAVALWNSDRGVELARLGAEPPAFGELDERAMWSLPAASGYFSCAPHAPEDAGGLLDTAGAAAKTGDWPRVRALLEPVALDTVAADQRAHHCHLLGLALLRTGGDPEAVRALWEAGQRDELEHERLFSCRLDACLDLLGPLPDPLPDAWWGPGASLVRRLRGVIATTDRLLAAGQVAGALQAIRQRIVTQTIELQSAARLAAAWLATDVTGGPACPAAFDKAVALSRFLWLQQLGCANLPVPEAWDADRLASVAAEATRWLAAWNAA